VNRQYVRPSRQPGGIPATLYDVSDGSAIDLKIEGKIPSEVWRPIYNQLTGRDVTRPEVTGRWTALRNSADADCARKSKNKKNDASEAVSWFHSGHYTCELRFDQHNKQQFSKRFERLPPRFSCDARGTVFAPPKIGNSFVKIHRRKLTNIGNERS
jgi:hypothetical protein